MDGRISNFQQQASLRRYTMTEGSEKGLDVIDCDNGKIRFLLNVSKALDIMQLYHEGQNVSFLSKNAFVAREIPFTRRFEGGMLYTCGYNAAGNVPGHELHGTLHTTPARVTRMECDENGILVEAQIHDTELFGKNLVLRRRITSAIGSGSVTVEDELTNEGFTEAGYGVLYHVNFGYPMLDEGAKISANVVSCVPRNAWAKENVGTMYEIEAPEAGKEETCYFLRLRTPEISLTNEKIGKKCTLSYSHDTLPEFTEWKSMASGDYALGLEPCSTVLDEAFTYTKIAPSETKKFFICLTVEKI